MKKNRRRPFAIDLLENRLLFSTFTVNAAGDGANYTDLETAIVDSPAGSTLLVSPGNYTAHATTINISPVFWINKSLTIESTGGAGVTTLTVPADTAENLLISASNVTVEGFTLEHGEFCVDVNDFVTNGQLTNETLQNLNVVPDPLVGHGILYEMVNHSIIDNCTVGLSYANGIMLDNNCTYDTVENCTVNGTVTQQGIAVKNSNYNLIVGNTVTASGFDGLFLLNAWYNRVTDNSLAGFQNDGLVVTSTSDFNYVALNTVSSSGLADGRTVGAAIWVNDGSNGNTVYANTASGAAECGIDVFVSSDNTISGNDVFGNYEGGIFVFDGKGDPNTVGSVPTNTVITNNFIHDNKTNGGVTLNGAVNTTIENNFISSTFTGKVGSSNAVGIDAQRTTNTVFVDNTVSSTTSGVYLYATNSGMSVYGNRFINNGPSFCLTGATVAFDDGPIIGGNYWSDQPTLKPYRKFVYSTTTKKRGGTFVDNYPFVTEAKKQAYSVTVTSPLAGTSVADFSKRVITWNSTGSSMVDIYYTSSETGDVLIAANRGDTGVYVWTIPALAAYGDYQIKIVPKNLFNVTEGPAGLSGQFAVTSSSGLQLLAPGDSQTLTPGSTTTVAWSSTTPGAPVDVQIQTDSGAWTTLAAGVTEDWANVTLPGTITNDARVRVVLQGTSTGDEQDGTFRLSSFGGVYNLGNQLIGSTGSVSWLSPAGSSTVNVQFWNGLGWQTIATQAPDIGHLNWLVPEMATNNAQVQIQFLDSTGATISSAMGNTFNIQYTLATGTLESVYTASNPGNHAEVLTTSLAEYRSLRARGWTALGTSFDAYSAPVTIDGVSATPNYRLYDSATRQYLFTTNRTEYLTLRASKGWVSQGIAGYEFINPVTGSIPLYRATTGKTGQISNWTTNLTQYNQLLLKHWTGQGVDAYVLPVQG